MIRALLGFDIGGTFTDFVLFDASSGELSFHKVPTSANDPSVGAILGIRQVLKERGVDPGDVIAVLHGTTIATNAVLEGGYAKTALITTRGFRDVLELGRQGRPDFYDLDMAKPDAIVPRHLRMEVKERINHEGEEVEALDQKELANVVKSLAKEGIEAVAVCFLHSYANSSHEIIVRDTLAALDSSYAVCMSSELVPEYREYERTTSTVLNAALLPVMSRYLDQLESECRSLGIGVPLQVMQSNGGMMQATTAATRPINTFLSGPAAGVIGAVQVDPAMRDFLTLDMGGTSTDVSVVLGGEPALRREHKIAGLPVRASIVDIHTVGAGGGSIAWIDDGGLMRVGPHSAGAFPGPACYGRGGNSPTVTDACLILGRLGLNSLLGGRMNLNLGAAQEAIRSVAHHLDMGEIHAAWGIYRIAVSNVVEAVRAVSIGQGHDPRELVLVPYGGAGPMFAGDIAAELGIEKIVVPNHPGVMCAAGLLCSPLMYEVSRTKIVRLDSDALPLITRLAKELRSELAGRCEAEQVKEEDMRWTFTGDLRYVGQDFELEVSTSVRQPGMEIDIEALRATFHAEHVRRYGYARGNKPVELVTLRLTASGEVRSLPWSSALPRYVTDEPQSREVWFTKSQAAHTPVYIRDGLSPGWRTRGPAIIEQMDSTVVVLPGMTASVAPHGHLVVEQSGEKQ